MKTLFYSLCLLILLNTSIIHAQFLQNATLGSKMGSSANINGSLLPEQHLLGYKKVGSKDVYYYIHRQCNSLVNASDSSSSGYVQFTYSTDYGATWDTSKRYVFVKTGNSKIRPRYPSGDLFLPHGDTDMTHAYYVASGPVTSRSTATAWIGNWFGSMRTDTMHKHYHIQGYDTTAACVNGVFPRISTTATTHHVWALGYNENPNSIKNPRFRGLTLYKATFDSIVDTFTWSNRVWALPTKTYVTLLGDTASYIAYANMAWGNDGRTGYVVACNVDSAGPGNDHFKYHIWKTTDEGATWTTSVLDPSDSVLNPFKDSIPYIAGHPGIKNIVPANDEDMVVDANGYLHIVSGFTGAFSANSDSLFYYYSTFGGNPVLPYLLDIFQTSTSNWNYSVISKLLTTQVLSSTSGNTYLTGTGGNEAWGSRVEASCEYNDNVMMYSWTDSDPYLNSANLAPDIYVKATNLNTGLFTNTFNMTVNGLYSQEIYWYYAAKRIYKHTDSGKTTYTIPAMSSLPFDQSNLNGSAPHNHFFITGLDIPADSFYAPCQAMFTIDSTDTVHHIVYVTNRSTGMLSHTWYFGDGDSSTSAVFTHNYTVGGTYNLCLKVRCMFGDTSRYCHNINGDSSRIRSLHPFGVHIRQANVGTQELTTKNGELRIYPNPFNNYIHIDMPDNTIEANINVYDILGQQVMKQSVKNTTNTMLDLSALNAGVYIIQVKAANGQWTSKVVKQN